MNFKVGDKVRVVKIGSIGSQQKFGQVVTIHSIGTSPNFKKNTHYITTGDSGGIWIDEIRHLTKLERALQ